jgi:hypothetical protein
MLRRDVMICGMAADFRIASPPRLWFEIEASEGTVCQGEETRPRLQFAFGCRG